MNLSDVMTEVAEQLDTIAGLRVFDWPVGSAVPPFAFVDYPTSYGFDKGYARGMDQLNLPVVVAVAKVGDRTAKDRLGQYVDGSGSKSVKAVLEAGTYTSFDSLRVQSVEFDVYQLGDSKYLAATFDIDVAGQGS